MCILFFGHVRNHTQKRMGSVKQMCSAVGIGAIETTF